MTQLTSSQYWQRGQRHESHGDYAAARAEYEGLLALESRHIPANLRMSRFAQIEGRYRDAHRHSLRAADGARLGGSLRHLAYVTMRLLDFSEDAEVASVILSADWQDPDVMRQSPSLAQHLWLAGRYADALRFIDEVIPRLPPHPLLRFTRGNVLRYLGRLDEAADDYERALALNPDLADAHWAIATLRPSAPPLSRVPRLQAALRRQADASPLARAHLHYALFRELDAAGDTGPAWEALARGAEIMHAALRPDVHAQTQRLKALATAAWEPTVPVADADTGVQPLPIFVAGLPRTGTTLLDRILGQHGWVTPVGERNDFAAAVSEVSDRFFGTLANTPDPEALRDIDHRAVGHHYLQHLKRLAPATAFALDKNPQNMFNLPLILRALPQAKILILRRDPMDAAFSNLKELFQGGAYPYSYDFSGLAAHVRASGDWIAHWAATAPHAIRVVSYEALASEPERTIAPLLEFIGLPDWPGLTDIERNAAPVATASSAQVRRPIHSGAIGAWRRYASPLQPLQQALEPLAP